MLFLDFKGDEMELGPEVLNELQRFAPNRVVSICGRNYPQLQTIADEPNILCFYSVGDEKEWPEAQKLIAAADFPALSIKANLATPERMQWLDDIGGVAVAWDVQTPEEARSLRALGVDGFTTDNPELLTAIRKQREGEA